MCLPIKLRYYECHFRDDGITGLGEDDISVCYIQKAFVSIPTSVDYVQRDTFNLMGNELTYEVNLDHEQLQKF